MQIVVSETVYGTDSSGTMRVIDAKAHTGLVRLVAKNGGLREKAMLSGDEAAAAKTAKGKKRKKRASTSKKPSDQSRADVFPLDATSAAAAEAMGFDSAGADFVVPNTPISTMPSLPTAVSLAAAARTAQAAADAAQALAVTATRAAMKATEDLAREEATIRGGMPSPPYTHPTTGVTAAAASASITPPSPHKPLRAASATPPEGEHLKTKAFNITPELGGTLVDGAPAPISARSLFARDSHGHDASPKKRIKFENGDGDGDGDGDSPHRAASMDVKVATPAAAAAAASCTAAVGGSAAGASAFASPYSLPGAAAGATAAVAPNLTEQLAAAQALFAQSPALAAAFAAAMSQVQTPIGSAHAKAEAKVQRDLQTHMHAQAPSPAAPNAVHVTTAGRTTTIPAKLIS